MREQRFQQIMTLVGAFFMVLGLIAIAIGWYGTARTGYVFEQIPYLVSGGLFGLGLTFTGALVFFSSWLARIVQLQRQQNELTQRLLDQLSNEDSVDGEEVPATREMRHTIAIPRAR
ncbi:hypothetical protein [Allorhizocola rhizosphaerae]|uniref:hypothetical protein n=1 Tax=Allorhizocola rhizosphaerae TaxID=1872709 RepID=UPI000E3C53AD|nr:hypothetical protein [Allorhizocola rhizosphaerae]